jgi:hypothetical protein
VVFTKKYYSNTHYVTILKKTRKKRRKMNENNEIDSSYK